MEAPGRLTGAGRTATWTSFAMPATISLGGQELRWPYGPERQRIRETLTGAAHTLHVAGFAGAHAQGLPTRLMVGLHLIKHMDGLSDDAVCARFLDSPYVQLFCGESHFQHALPLDRSSMTRWRKRIGAEQLELLLTETLAVAQRAGAAEPKHFERVTIDTTIQPKAVTHPTDSKLLHRGIEILGRLARQHGIALRQSYVRVSTHARREIAKLIHRGHNADKDRVFVSRQKRGVTPTIRREIRRRAGIEPVIGQMKEDGNLGRNLLAGATGDAINVVLAAAGHNLRLLRAWLIRLLAFLIILLAISRPAAQLHSPQLAAR